MNKGRRYLLNTVFALYASAALFVVVNRLQMATIHAGAPQWLRSTLSLGLAPVEKPELVLGSALAGLALHDFSQLQVSGPLNVEIVGAAEYRVSLTAANDLDLPLAVRQKGDRLRLDAVVSGKGAPELVLRIETPTLTRVDARNLRNLTLRGLQVQAVAVDLRNVAAARLQQNQVARWRLNSTTSLEVQVDQATLAAGQLRTAGALTIRNGE